jgi:hypothetical protein
VSKIIREIIIRTGRGKVSETRPKNAIGIPSPKYLGNRSAYIAVVGPYANEVEQPAERLVATPQLARCTLVAIVHLSPQLLAAQQPIAAEDCQAQTFGPTLAERLAVDQLAIRGRTSDHCQQSRQPS